MNIDNYTKMFDNLNPSDKLNGITDDAESLISTAKNLLSGGGFSLPFC